MVNRVTLLGNVGVDPEIRMTQNGTKVASFSLATSEVWNDKTTGEKVKNTTWHKVVVFNENIANIIQLYVKKGSKLYIEGSLSSRKYTDSGGTERSITEIVIGRFKGELVLLNSANKDNDYSEQSPQNVKGINNKSDDDVFF